MAGRRSFNQLFTLLFYRMDDTDAVFVIFSQRVSLPGVSIYLSPRLVFFTTVPPLYWLLVISLCLAFTIRRESRSFPRYRPGPLDANITRYQAIMITVALLLALNHCARHSPECLFANLSYCGISAFWTPCYYISPQRICLWRIYL